MNKLPRYHGFVDTLNENNERIPEYLKQLEERGFDDTESWDFFTTITSFIYPRFKEFIESYKKSLMDLTKAINPNDLGWKKVYNTNTLEFNANLDKALRAFEIIYKGEVSEDKNDREMYGGYLFKDEVAKEVTDGLHAFAEVFLGLWN